MCDYCGCQQRTTIDDLTAEHAAIGAVADRLAAAHAAGDRTSGRAMCAELVTLLSPHTRREEEGLFTELAAVGLEGHTERLTADHDALDAAFEAVLAGDDRAWERLPAALRRLEQHIWSEEYDAFPAALQVLSDDAWTRLEAGDSTVAGTGASRG